MDSPSAGTAGYRIRGHRTLRRPSVYGGRTKNPVWSV